MLHKLADNYAAVYAAAAGKDAADVRKMMLATTWLTAEEAIEQKFATAKIQEPATAMAAFDYAMYANSPDGLPLRKRGSVTDPTGQNVNLVAPAAARMRMRQAAL